MEIDSQGGTPLRQLNLTRVFDAPRVGVFTSGAIEDEHGVPGLEVLTTVRFFEQGQQTRLTVEAKVLRATPAAAQALAGMEPGWLQQLDRLAAHLKAASA